jgi:hypothetical protein
MIVVLTVMSNMNLFCLNLVGLVQGMQQVRRLWAWFGYRWDACGHGLATVLATGVTPLSLRPLITVGNLGSWSCLYIV